MLPDCEVERSAYPVLLLTAEAEERQLEQVRVWVFCAQPRGEEMMAEERARPLPARRPPKVVDAVPPRRTAMVEEAVTSPVPSPTRTPLVNEENLTVEEAKRVPKKGEELALNAWSVPAERMAMGPLAVKVWVAPVRPPRDVMPDPEEMHVPSMAKHPSARSIPPVP